MNQLTTTADLLALNLRKVLDAHGHLPAFEQALAGGRRKAFDVQLEKLPRHLLRIRVLPKTETGFKVPVVEAAKSDLFNGRTLRVLTIRLAVKAEGWQPYALDDTPDGIRYNALDKQKKSQPSLAGELAWISRVFARQLIEQGWAGQRIGRTQPVKPKL